MTKSDEGSSQSYASKFVVSSIPSSKDYRISIRHHESGNVEHIIISYNDEDQSYGIEREVLQTDICAFTKGRFIVSIKRLHENKLFQRILSSGMISEL